MNKYAKVSETDMKRDQYGMSVKCRDDIIDCRKPRILKAVSTPLEKESSAPSCTSRLISKMHHILCPSSWKASQACAQNAKAANNAIDPQCCSRSFLKQPQENFEQEEGPVSSTSKQFAIKKTQQDMARTSAFQRSAIGPARGMMLNDSSTEYIASAAKSIDSEAAKREAQCIVFYGDEDSDYTRGPIRIITASDGVDDNCAVLLLNRRFSDSIKAAISARRELVKFIQTSQEQDKVAEESRRMVRETIERYRLRIVSLEAEATNTNMRKSTAHALEREMREIHAKIDELEKALYADAREQSIRENSLQLRYKDCFKAYEVAHQFLEAAFVDARLLSPLPNTIRGPFPRNLDSDDCHHQNEKISWARRAPGDGLANQRHEEEVAARQYNSEKYAHEETQQPVITEGTSSTPKGRASSHHISETAELQEASTASHLRRAYVSAKHRLDRAQREFDVRDETRAHEQYWNDRDMRRSGGTEGISQEEFDLLWVEHNSKLTRKLINAEEALKTALVAAIKGGCQFDDLAVSSVDEDDDNEGYPPSPEAVWKANAPNEMIEGWRMSLADDSDFPHSSAASAELDSRDGDEADLRGSFSVVADPPRQEKIKQWEKACTAVGKRPVT